MTVSLLKIAIFCDEPGICNFNFLGKSSNANADEEKKKKYPVFFHFMQRFRVNNL
jgi:hypothetical protein